MSMTITILILISINAFIAVIFKYGNCVYKFFKNFTKKDWFELYVGLSYVFWLFSLLIWWPVIVELAKKSH